MSDTTEDRKSKEEPLLALENLKTHFFLDEGTVRAVDGVTLNIPKGKTVGIVGESGCGKSITAFSVLRLITHPGQIVDGSIVLNTNGRRQVLTDMKEDSREIRDIRGNHIAMIFQEPMTSFSPVHTVGDQIAEVFRLHRGLKGKDARKETVKIMERVGIPDSARRFDQYPFEMSGGLRQRSMIAMALACRPSLLIADEPTTALDVTIQAQILELMRELQEEFHMSILLITHDLGVVAEMADEVGVMYMGRIVEYADATRIFDNPQHPYTRALMDSIPGRAASRKTALNTIKGSVPDPFSSIPGCPFHPRCDEAIAGKCDAGDRPPLLETRPGPRNACLIRHEEVSRV